MWSALKTDLFDFVSTIQEDTTKTLSRVLGDEEVDVAVIIPLLSLCCFSYLIIFNCKLIIGGGRKLIEQVDR